MAINVTTSLRPCFNCDIGFFIKIKKPKSYDFNEDGWVPFYCNACGVCNDNDRDMRRDCNVIEHRFIERVLERLSNTKLHKDYAFKRELFKLLKKETFSEFSTLAEKIVMHCHSHDYPVGKDYVLKLIHSELDYSSFIELSVTSP